MKKAALSAAFEALRMPTDARMWANTYGVDVVRALHECRDHQLLLRLAGKLAAYGYVPRPQIVKCAVLFASLAAHIAQPGDGRLGLAVKTLAKFTKGDRALRDLQDACWRLNYQRTNTTCASVYATDAILHASHAAVDATYHATYSLARNAEYAADALLHTQGVAPGLDVHEYILATIRRELNPFLLVGCVQFQLEVGSTT